MQLRTATKAAPCHVGPYTLPVKIVEKVYIQALKLILFEASYFYRINMTKNQLEYDQKIITPINMNDGIWPKHYTDEHERLNMTKIPMEMTKILKALNSLGLRTD